MKDSLLPTAVKDKVSHHMAYSVLRTCIQLYDMEALTHPPARLNGGGEKPHVLEDSSRIYRRSRGLHTALSLEWIAIREAATKGHVHVNRISTVGLSGGTQTECFMPTTQI